MTKEAVASALKEIKNTVHVYYQKDGGIREFFDVKKLFSCKSNTLCYHTTWQDYEILYEDVFIVSSTSQNFDTSITLGADPELFFMKDGVMIPSTAVIKNETQLVARDGFQLELHPIAQTCRQVLANYIGDSIREAHDMAIRAGASISFKLSHVVSDDVWGSVPKEMKRFGCNPSFNVYKEVRKICTGMREKFRAGGGHIHVGNLNLAEKNDLTTIVKLFDIIVGNTMVLLDRDEANITRRKNYGRAGEHRPKPYGVEYRTPSNFWLRHYVLLSLVMGLIRNAMTLYRAGKSAEVMALFNMKDIRGAINKNDYDLALKNFNIYSTYLKDNSVLFGVGISSHNVDKFYKWLNKTDPLSLLNNGSDLSILRHWQGMSAGSTEGFERFINRIS